MKRGHFSADGTCQACSRSEIILLAVLLCLSVFVRLIQISQPFMDAWSWRQADDAMIARNFYGHGYDIFYPQIDWAGSLPGYVGTEFPLVTFVAALLYPLFGVREWVGRSISVLFFAASVPLFYLFVKKVFNERSAFCAVAIYACTPLTVFAARSFMPDMASLGLSSSPRLLLACHSPTWLGSKMVHGSCAIAGYGSWLYCVYFFHFVGTVTLTS